MGYRVALMLDEENSCWGADGMLFWLTTDFMTGGHVTHTLTLDASGWRLDHDCSECPIHTALQDDEWWERWDRPVPSSWAVDMVDGRLGLERLS